MTDDTFLTTLFGISDGNGLLVVELRVEDGECTLIYSGAMLIAGICAGLSSLWAYLRKPTTDARREKARD